VWEESCVVLDLGCGSNWFTRGAFRVSGLAIGVDIVVSMRWAEDRDSGVEFVVDDAWLLH